VLLFQSEPMLGEQQVAGGGNRQELCDALDDAEEDCREPVLHAGIVVDSDCHCTILRSAAFLDAVQLATASEISVSPFRKSYRPRSHLW